MKLSEVMETLATLAATGASTGDDMVLAIDTSSSQNAPDGDYVVAQVGIKSQSSSLNAETKTTAYIRQGKSTTKTGNQRTIEFEWDRVIGDEFQDFADSFDIKYGTGADVVVNYIWLNARSKKGEKGQGALIIDTDADSTPEENLGGSGSIQKTGANPVEYTWTDPTPTTYTVTFNSNGGSAVASQTVADGGKVTEPADPTKDGYTFGGWYKEDTLTTEWDFSTDTVSAATTLYAKWTEQ